MKILYSLPAIQVAGGVVHFLQVAKRLADRGHTVTLQAPILQDLDVLPSLPSTVKIEKIEGVDSNLYTLPSEKEFGRFLQSLKDLTLGLNSIAAAIPSDTDVVHAGFHPNAKAAVLARRRGGWKGRIIQAVHMDPITFLPQSYRKRYAWLFRKTPFLSDHLLTVCEPLREKLQRYGKPVTNVKNGVDPLFLETPHPQREENPEQPTILYCGAIGKRKGIDVLLSAFAKTRERFPKSKLILTGRGSWETYYRGLAEELGVLDRVNYLGVVSMEAMVELMDEAAVFAFPTWSEGFGLPPLEAMARGCAVVTTRNDGTDQYVREGANCVLVEPGNPEDLARALSRLMEDSGLRGRLGAAGIETAREYTWEKVTDRTQEAMRMECSKL